MKVMKFGGGCLKNYEHLLKTAEIIKAEEDFPVVIVSAISGITNLLEKGIQKARESGKRTSEVIPEIIKDIRDKHQYICEASIKNDDIKHRTMDEIESRLKRLERLFYGISYTEEVTKSLKALILSYGERLSALVLPGGYESEDIVKSVTYNRQISVLRIHGPGVGFKPGIIAEIGRLLSKKGINIYSVITSQTCINLLVNKNDSRKSYESIKK